MSTLHRWSTLLGTGALVAGASPASTARASSATWTIGRMKMTIRIAALCAECVKEETTIPSVRGMHFIS